MGAYSLALGAGAILLDYASGPDIQAPIVIVIPVVLAGWYGFLRTSLLLAVALPFGRMLAEIAIWHPDTLYWVASVNAATRFGVLVTLALLAHRAGAAHELRRRVRILEGILPICAFCKRIRDANESWQPLESYISGRSEATFSHGFCPDCARKHYGEYLDGD